MVKVGDMVICISNGFMGAYYLTPGNKYQVLSSFDGRIVVNNDNDTRSSYPSKVFDTISRVRNGVIDEILNI